MTRPAAVDVWLYGTPVARLTEDFRRGLQMHWTPEATRRWPVNSTVLSVLLPTSRQPPHSARVRAFFAGLMPEGDARTRLAFEAGVQPDDVFGRLTAYGRDVAGALEIHPEGAGEPSNEGSLKPISDDAIREKLLRAARVPGWRAVHSHPEARPRRLAHCRSDPQRGVLPGSGASARPDNRQR